MKIKLYIDKKDVILGNNSFAIEPSSIKNPKAIWDLLKSLNFEFVGIDRFLDSPEDIYDYIGLILIHKDKVSYSKGILKDFLPNGSTFPQKLNQYVRINDKFYKR